MLSYIVFTISTCYYTLLTNRHIWLDSTIDTTALFPGPKFPLLVSFIRCTIFRIRNIPNNLQTSVNDSNPKDN